MGPVKAPTPPTTTINTPTGFRPINRVTTPTNNGKVATTTSISGGSGTLPASKITTLRMLSGTPVGGYGASSTSATTTNVRWVDRGRGNVYEANYTNPTIVTLSNTVVPKIVASIWNKNLTAFVASMFEDGSDLPTTVYTTINLQASSTSATEYNLRGKTISGNVIGYAASPDQTKLFIFMNEGGNGVGYVSSFDGKGMTKLFSTPLTQVNVDWPAPDAITLTTKGSATASGFMYFVSPKTGTWKKVVGPKMGLSAKANHDGKHVAYSAVTSDGSIETNILNISTGKVTDAFVKTLIDKCAWGNFYKDLLYCAAPTQEPDGVLPDDWYLGKTSTIDKIWQVSASTGELKALPSLLDQADRAIDAFNLGLDNRDNYLFFMNKTDLSLWSLDLVRGR